jgi:hypothetical protein
MSFLKSSHQTISCLQGFEGFQRPDDIVARTLLTLHRTSQQIDASAWEPMKATPRAPYGAEIFET